MKQLILLLMTLALISCENDNEVNLLGEWRYTFTTDQPECEGMEATGFQTYQSLNGDLSKIGNVYTQGEGFSTDFIGNCSLKYYSFTDANYNGKPSKQTRHQYERIEQKSFMINNNINSSSIQVDVLIFEENHILMTKNYANNYRVFTLSLTR